MSRSAWMRLAGTVSQSLDASRARARVEWVGFRASYWTGPARLLDGRLHATRWKREVANAVARRGEALGAPPPGLAAVVVGDRADSLLYVRRKGEACEAAGMRFFHEHLPGDVDQETVRATLRRLNEDDDVHGVLLQLPVPSHLSESRLLECINPRKDVDGLHPNNVGRLAMRGVWRPAFMPCAPLGCAELLRREGVRVRGKAVAVVGDSNVVGMPMSWLMRDAGAASTTLLHTHAVDFLKRAKNEDARLRDGTRGETKSETVRARDDVLRAVRDADIVVVGVGSPEIVTSDWVKPGAVVVDIGINAVPLRDETERFETGTADERNAYALPGRAAFSVVGDVNAEDVSRVAGAMTSVPGGAGPMTIAALLSNTFLGASRRDRRAR